MAEETTFEWHEVRGVSPSSDLIATRRAMTRLVLAYHPDGGGTQRRMTRINAAYEANAGQYGKAPAGREAPLPAPSQPAPSLKR